MYKATRPLEYICFYPIEIPTEEGDVYMFTVLDVYSLYIFNTGIEKKRDVENVIKHIKLIPQHEDFKKSKGKPFTLILPNSDLLLTEKIESIVTPFKGKVIIDDIFVAKMFKPVMIDLFKSIARQIEEDSKK